jgi:hypothetical protein
MTRPSLFIGSSTEGLALAQGVRALLDADAEVSLWNEGFFKPGKTFIESLINGLTGFDFAVLVLTPDDLTSSRSVETLSPRDNVIFELGLFMGRIGRQRTLLLHQADADLKLPSDLAGLAAVTYRWPRADGSHRAAVAAACDDIRRVMRQRGPRKKHAQAIEGIASRQNAQDEKIRSLQVALQGIVTLYERDKLIGMAGAAPFMCYYSDDLHAELKRLRAMGFVHHREGVGLTAIRNRFKDRNEQFDLKEYFYLTPPGVEYLKLLGQNPQPASQRAANPRPPAAPQAQP